MTPAAAPDRPPARATPFSSQLRRILEGEPSASAAARAAGVVPSVVSEFVNGRRGLTLDTIDKIFAALRLSIAREGRPTK